MFAGRLYDKSVFDWWAKENGYDVSELELVHDWSPFRIWQSVYYRDPGQWYFWHASIQAIGKNARDPEGKPVTLIALHNTSLLLHIRTQHEVCLCL